MEWHAELETDRDALKRIAALLLALAGLADRASGLPGPVVCLVLWFLRPAEAVAREFVTGKAPQRGAPALPQAYAPTSVDGPNAEAARLAFCFRVLALALGTMLARSRPLAPSHSHQTWPANSPRPAYGALDRPKAIGAILSPSPPCFDTS